MQLLSKFFFECLIFVKKSAFMSDLRFVLKGKLLHRRRNQASITILLWRAYFFRRYQYFRQVARVPRSAQMGELTSYEQLPVGFAMQ